MEIRLLKNFVKMVDETKQPSGEYISKNVRLKEKTSIMSPTFILSDYDERYNYFYVPKWSRYYFVSDVVLNIEGLWEVSGEFDHLASYKDSIGAYTCYVERAESRYDRLINDPLVSQRQYVIHESDTPTSFDGMFNTAGCYILRTKAKNSDTETGINSYALTKGQLGLFLNDCFNTSNYGDIFVDVADEVLKGVFDPMDYVISIAWVPFSAYGDGSISGQSVNNTSKIKLGWWEVDAEGYKMGASALTFNKDIDIPNSYFNDWRDYNPMFTDIKMILPCVGLIDFDPIQACYPDDTTVKLNILYSIDCSTGEGEVFIRNKSSDGKIITIAKYKANTCSNIQISQTTFNLTGAVKDTITALGGLASGNIPMTVMSGVSAIGNLIKPTTSTMGVNGSKTSINNYLYVHVYVQHYGSKDTPIHKGHPLHENVRIGTLEGYIQCAGASINNIAGTIADKERINNSLNSGFFYT